MSILPRPALALAAVLVLNLGTAWSWGFYTTQSFVAVVSAFALATAACIARPRPLTLSRSPAHPDASGTYDPLMLILALCVAIQFAVALFCFDLLYGEIPLLARVRGFTGLGIAIVIAMALMPVLRLADARRPNAALLGAALVIMIGFLIRMLVIIASPDPVIDVFNVLRDGADHVLTGQNPYTSDIISPYGTPRAFQFGVFEPPDPRPAGYPPLPLLLAIPPRLLGADVRWSNVACDLIAALTLIGLGWRRRAYWVGVLAAALYLTAPRAPFIIEQAWYEPMIAALLGLGLVLSEFRSWARWLGSILLGLGLTAKQFGLPLLFPLSWGHRRHWRLILLGLAVGGLIMLPWIVWSPRDFFDIILWKHLDRPLQPHSITVASFLLNEFGVTMPRLIGWLLAGGAIIGISAIAPKNSAATALGLPPAPLAISQKPVAAPAASWSNKALPALPSAPPAARPAGSHHAACCNASRIGAACFAADGRRARLSF